MSAKSKQEGRGMSEVERLGLRVSEMINSPRAQERCSALIHRLETDSDQAWDAVMTLLAEESDLAMTFQDDGSVLLEWRMPTADDCMVGGAELASLDAAMS